MILRYYEKGIVELKNGNSFKSASKRFKVDQVSSMNQIKDDKFDKDWTQTGIS